MISSTPWSELVSSGMLLTRLFDCNGVARIARS
jgi:hypothetical protein